MNAEMNQVIMKECFVKLKTHATNNKRPFYKEAVVLRVSADEYFAEYPNSNSFTKDIPVKRIDGISVDVSLAVKKYPNSNGIMIDIETDGLEVKMCDCNGCDCDRTKLQLYYASLMDYTNRQLTTEDYVEALTKLHDTFQKIYFSKYHGNFLLKKTTAYMGCSFWDKMIGDNPKIEKKYANCCVCMEGTLSKTKCCSQSLCVECFGNIKPVMCMSCQDEDGSCDLGVMCGDRPCPLCRKSLNCGELFPEH